MLLARLTSWEEAPDLLQETFLRVYKARPEKFNGHLPAKYLVRAAETTATDYKRSQYVVKAATAEYLEHLKSHNQAQPNAERRVLVREVQDAAKHLSPDDQELLQNYSESTSITAEAQRIGIPTTTLASRYYAAFKRLRRQLTRRQA